jgi:hypothetical protein
MSDPKEALERLTRLAAHIGEKVEPAVYPHTDHGRTICAADLRTLIAEREGLEREVATKDGVIADMSRRSDAWRDLVAEREEQLRQSASKLSVLEAEVLYETDRANRLYRNWTESEATLSALETGLRRVIAYCDEDGIEGVLASIIRDKLRALLHPTVPVETEARATPDQGYEHPTPPDGLASSGGLGPVQDVAGLCSDCPPVGYITDKTRCLRCPRAVAPPSQGTDNKFAKPTGRPPADDRWSKPPEPETGESPVGSGGVNSHPDVSGLVEALNAICAIRISKEADNIWTGVNKASAIARDALAAFQSRQEEG